jgi:hypothetical protein
VINLFFQADPLLEINHVLAEFYSKMLPNMSRKKPGNEHQHQYGANSEFDKVVMNCSFVVSTTSGTSLIPLSF